MNKVNVVSLYDIEFSAHMTDFETCPSCGFEQDPTEWDKCCKVFRFN